MGDLGLTATDGKVTTPVPLDAPDSAQNQRRAKAARRRLGIGASGMLPELGGWDKNSANGMTGTIASTTVLDITAITRTTAGLNTVLHACVTVDVRTVLRNSNSTVPSRTRL